MIVLTGPMGSGKSTVARLLGEITGLPVIDTDAEVERSERASIAEIFERNGEARFRALEAEVVAESLAGDPAVVALGGGALLGGATRRALLASDALVIHLHAGADAIAERLGDDRSRPLLTDDLSKMLALRMPGYQECATFRIDTASTTPRATAQKIAALYALDRVQVVTGSGGYPVIVGEDVAWTLGLCPAAAQAEQAFVVTHPGLAEVAAPFVAALEERLPVTVIEVPEGETSKSLESAGEVLERLADAAAHRHDLVAGVGGGVVTDLAGYVASVYNRGMPVVHVPTTMLGMVDAAVGGKTAVDLPQGKNLVGTFHQPAAVLADLTTLETLPEKEFVSGLAEVVKYGFIADPTVLELLADPRWNVSELVLRSVRIKADIVGQDERDGGIRHLLNYGHTFAHAIETTRGYGAIRHGEAVAIGMMAAAHLAHVKGRIGAELVDEHRRILLSLGLPASAQLDRETLSRAWERDKKFSGRVRFVLLSGRGAAEAGVTATDDEIDLALERLAR